MLEEEVEYQAELIRQLTEQTRALSVDDYSGKEEAVEAEREEHEDESHSQQEEVTIAEAPVASEATEVVV